MIGTLLNVAGILLGGITGLVRTAPVTPASESFFKVTTGAFTVFYGLQLTWNSLGGSFGQILKQLGLAVLALILGRLTGQLLGFQKFSNRIGRAARANIDAAAQGRLKDSEQGFLTCASLFCAAPLGILGAVQDGLTGYAYPLAMKGVIDGFATLGFVRLFGPGSILSAIPVLAFEGSLTLLTLRFLRPYLETRELLHSVNAAGGLLVFAVALVMLGLKRIALADYLPSLFFAPLLTYLFK